MTSYHYHAELECGHKTGFDLNVDMLQTTIDEGGDDFVVVMPCHECGGADVRSVDVMPGGQDVAVCLTCGKGAR